MRNALDCPVPAWAARILLAVGLGAALTWAAPPRVEAAETIPSAGEVEVYLPGPGDNFRHYLTVDLFPERGIAAVSTSQGEQLSRGTLLDNSYAIEIPKTPFDGSIELKLPGVGEVVGTVVPDEAIPVKLPAKVCGDPSPGHAATFEGRIHFRGFGGYPPWDGRQAEASVAPDCDPASKSTGGGKALFGALAAFGPVLPGPAAFGCFAHALSRTRYVEFVAFGEARPGSDGGTFVAVDREWLPGDIATQRIVELATRRFARSVVVGPGGEHPRRATFAPPAPFFGHATYRRRAGKLRGTLGVRFLGLRLHLAARPMTASVFDEEPVADQLGGPRPDGVGWTF